MVIKYNAEIRSKLETLFSFHKEEKMSPYQRVTAAVNRHIPDRVPFDFWAVPEMISSLKVSTRRER